MYPDESISFLDLQSCSNLYSLKKTIKEKTCSIVLGAGASASVGLPTWNCFLKRICYTFFYHWVFDVYYKKNNCSYDTPPKNMAVAFAGFYDFYLHEKEANDIDSIFIETPENVEIYIGDKKLSKEKVVDFITRNREQKELIELLQDDFMEKIMSRDSLLIAQMIKNRIRPKDWDYLLRKSLYNSFEDNPYQLRISPLYSSLCKLIATFKINCVINYNYDDTFYHSLKRLGIRFQNIYDGKELNTGYPPIYYPHGYIPMCGGVKTKIVLSEQDYQRQGLQMDLWANNIQIRTYCSYPTVFIGLSLIDANMRRLLNQCRNSLRKYHYAFLPGSGDAPTARMMDSLHNADLYRLGIKVIRYPITDNKDNPHEHLIHAIDFLF